MIVREHAYGMCVHACLPLTQFVLPFCWLACMYGLLYYGIVFIITLSHLCLILGLGIIILWETWKCRIGHTEVTPDPSTHVHVPPHPHLQ